MLGGPQQQQTSGQVGAPLSLHCHASHAACQGQGMYCGCLRWLHSSRAGLLPWQTITQASGWGAAPKRVRPAAQSCCSPASHKHHKAPHNPLVAQLADPRCPDICMPVKVIGGSERDVNLAAEILLGADLHSQLATLVLKVVGGLLAACLHCLGGPGAVRQEVSGPVQRNRDTCSPGRCCSGPGGHVEVLPEWVSARGLPSPVDGGRWRQDMLPF